MTIPQVLELAIQRHQSGRLSEAEALYRQILAAQPNHADALHLLGVMAHQAGRDDLAVEWIRQAIVINPYNPVAHSNLGETYRKMGRHEEAMAEYRRALELQPGYPEAHNNLGNALRERGQFAEAIAEYRRAVELKPGYPEAHNNLGVALRERGQFDEAVLAFHRALELRPNYPEAHYNLGNALRSRGQLDQAIVAYRRALELKPGFPEARNNLGIALAGQGQLDGAIAEYRRALELEPGYPEACNNLGAALARRGRLDEAIAAYRRALELKPGYPEAHNNLGNALRERGQHDEAVASCRRALELKPDYPEAHNNLGVTLRERGQPGEAIVEYRRALELRPDYPEVYNNLGVALKDQGELDKAIAAYRHSLELQPEQAWVHSNLVYALHFHPDHDARTIGEEHQRWNRRFGEPLKPFLQPHLNDRSPERRLRIGYVSPDFREHAVGRYILPLFRGHDHRNFEILGYSGVVRPDQFTEEFRRHAQHWRGTAGVSDEALAEMIRQDGVDILVDLTQHMADNRLSMFARQPAPVQISFAGYPDGTGLEAIEYRISDRYLEAASADEETGGKERVRLIDSFWCYEPDGMEVEINPLPALRNGSLTFGCLNNFCKANDRALSLWGRVLGKVKDSRLVISSRAGSQRQRTLEALEREGVGAHRVEFVAFHPWREYLELYQRIDIVLDTFPYNGGMTACDALWMGVPVVTLAGEAPVSRMGLSLLTNLGLPELVAHSETEYLNIAVSLAGDLPRLAQLRSTLRKRMKNSVLMDAPRFTRQVERAYREMWQAWRKG